MCLSKGARPYPIGTIRAGERLKHKEQLVESLEQQLRLTIAQTDGNPFFFIPIGYFERSWTKQWLYSKGYADRDEQIRLQGIPCIWSLAYVEMLEIQSLP
jgi:hypothetical protein